MILQALTQLFEDLAARGEIARPGWSPAKISFALCLDEDGNLTQIIPISVEKTVGKKTVTVPQTKELPAAVTRTVGVQPNFLWDNSSYLLGIDAKGKPERSKQCFAAAKELHEQLLDGLDSVAAKAIVSFFAHWEPSEAREYPAITENWDELMKGGNLVFRVDGKYVQEDADIRAAWEHHYSAGEGDTVKCLVTGRDDIPEAVHPVIKGVVGAQSSGAAVVSFNAPAFCSYGKEQSLNAPVGKYAAFAYTAALNHLLADRDNVHRVGDTTVVCWVEGADPAYNLFADFLCFGDDAPEQITEDVLRNTVSKLAEGRSCEELPLDMSRRFYILGLAPNAARLSVRFFCNSTFGELMKHVAEHQKRLEIVGNRYPVMPLWALLKETANPNAKEKTPDSAMSGAVARAVFNGTFYPASLLEEVMLRIRAEREITPGRAAILKAYYLKNTTDLCPKEVLTVSLNEASTNIPYTLGRLFAVYEALQEEANSEITTTIMDKYFNSASATPAVIFPILDNLAQKHLRKLETGKKIYYDKQIGRLKCILDETNPMRLSLPEQGAFNLGYYHQKQARYTKKEEK